MLRLCNCSAAMLVPYVARLPGHITCYARPCADEACGSPAAAEEARRRGSAAEGQVPT